MDARGAYTVVGSGSYTFRSLPVAIRAAGKWHKSSESGGDLHLESVDDVHGTDQLGAWTGKTARWSLVAASNGDGTHNKNNNSIDRRDNLNEKNIPVTWVTASAPTSSSSSSLIFETTVATYTKTGSCRMTYALPNGATGTAGDGYDKQGHAGVVTNFPALAISSTPAPSVFSWQGSFMNPNRGPTYGATGGPYVFFNGNDTAAGAVVVASTLDHPMTTSRAAAAYDGTPADWMAGTSDTVTALPAGFNHSFLLVMGTGVTKTMYEWGQLMQQYHNTRKLDDITLNTLGYQTDNGAQYCFGGHGPQTFYDEKTYLDSQHVPVRYLSFQGDGAMMTTRQFYQQQQQQQQLDQQQVGLGGAP
eukprot:UC1_evm1s292